jgi:hypothetical protein
MAPEARRRYLAELLNFTASLQVPDDHGDR